MRRFSLGDLGNDGVGIPMGKLALYSACAGIHPTKTLPVVLDVGTNNAEKLQDPLYMGLRQNRVTPLEEKEFVKEFMLATQQRWPGVVVQFEDVSANLSIFQRSSRLTCRVVLAVLDRVGVRSSSGAQRKLSHLQRRHPRDGSRLISRSH